MRIAVIGGGVFGSTASWYLAKKGYKVDLFEKENDIFQAASGINQYRLHKGYHYPRSIETIYTCLVGEREFRKYYPEAVMNSNIENYYCVSKKDSFLSSTQISKIWKNCGLQYERANPSIINFDSISGCFLVDENCFDHQILKSTIQKKMNENNVNIKFEINANLKTIEKYDFTVISTYVNNNLFLKNYPNAIKKYQYEICEKIVIKLPDKFKNKSVVVLDGPFTCIDPFGSTGYHVMGNVVHAVHETIVGERLHIPDKYLTLINKGIISNPEISNFKKFISSGRLFFNNFEKVKYIGSMFTIRTVLPFRDHDDARPTIVENIDNKMVSVFSGKISTCISSTKEVYKLLKRLN